MFGCEGGKAGVAVPSPVFTSPSLVRSELDWCRPFLCQDTVEIDGVTYPVTVLRDTAAQQSLCRNVTGRRVASGQPVWCQGIGTAEIRLTCPLVTVVARVALAEDLPVSDVDFLLENDLAGGRVWEQLPSADAVPNVKAAESADSVVTHPKARRAPRRLVPAGSVTPRVNCNKVGPPQKDRSVFIEAAVGTDFPETCPAADKGFDESELGSSLSQCARADCKSAEPPQEAPDFVESVAKGETRVMSLDCVFGGLPHPVETLGGGTYAELSTSVEAVGAGTQSGPQLVVSSVSGIAAWETFNPLGGEYPPLRSAPEAGSRELPCRDQTRWMFAQVVSQLCWQLLQQLSV